MKKSIAILAFPAVLLMGQDKPRIIERKVAVSTVGTLGAVPQVMFFTNDLDEAVKGSAYSADTVTEMVQVLADGNRITRTNKSSFARDSEGRTRRDSSIQHLGALGQATENLTSTFITDPVAQVSYTLDSKSKIAYKSKVEATPMKNRVMSRTITRTQTSEKNVVVGMSIAGSMVREEVHITKADGMPESKNSKVESLGERNIEGVIAKGTKVTVTIPAGEQGNERAIEIVTETWVSEQLKTTVLTKHSDPRFGETTTRLTNVKLSEPPRSLFEPPADFKVEEGPTGARTISAPMIIREEI